MTDYISRKAIITWIEKSLAMYHDKYSTDMLHMFGLFRSVIEDKSLFQTADVVERKKGKWKSYNNTDVCSICGSPKIFWSCNFCPNCGADMRAEDGAE